MKEVIPATYISILACYPCVGQCKVQKINVFMDLESNVAIFVDLPCPSKGIHQKLIFNEIFNWFSAKFSIEFTFIN